MIITESMFWAMYLFFGIPIGWLNMKKAHREWRASSDPTNLRTQGSWKVDYLIQVLFFFMGCMLWWALAAEWIALKLKKMFTKNKGEK